MLAHKDATVKSNVDGVAFLFKKNKIDAFQGTGKVLGQGKVSVTNDKGEEQVIETKNIVIATGSDVAGIPGVAVEIDEKVIISSTGGIALERCRRPWSSSAAASSALSSVRSGRASAPR